MFDESEIRGFLARRDTKSLIKSIGIENTISLLLKDIESPEVGHSNQVHIYELGSGSRRETSATLLVSLASELDDKQALAPLRKAVQQPDSFMRKVAFVALCEGSAHLKDETHVDILVQLQPGIEAEMGTASFVTPKGERRSASRELVFLLEQLFQAGKPDPLFSAIKSDSPTVAQYAVKALIEKGFHQEIIIAIEHGDLPKVAEYAAKALIGKGFGQAIIKAVEQGALPASVFTAGDKELPQSIEFLKQLLSSQVEKARSGAVLEMRYLMRYYPRSEQQLLEILLQALQSDLSPIVRSNVAYTFGELREKGALSALLQSLGDASPDVRESSCKAIREILLYYVVRRDNHPYNANEIELLKQALNSPSHDIQQLASDQLVKIGVLAPMEAPLEPGKSPDSEIRNTPAQSEAAGQASPDAASYRHLIAADTALDAGQNEEALLGYRRACEAGSPKTLEYIAARRVELEKRVGIKAANELMVLCLEPLVEYYKLHGSHQLQSCTMRLKEAKRKLSI